MGTTAMSIMVTDTITVMVTVMGMVMDTITDTTTDMVTADFMIMILERINQTNQKDQIKERNRAAGHQNNVKKLPKPPKRPRRTRRRLKNKRRRPTKQKEEATGPQKKPNGKPTSHNKCFFHNKHSNTC